MIGEKRRLNLKAFRPASAIPMVGHHHGQVVRVVRMLETPPSWSAFGPAYEVVAHDGWVGTVFERELEPV